MKYPWWDFPHWTGTVWAGVGVLVVVIIFIAGIRVPYNRFIDSRRKPDQGTVNRRTSKITWEPRKKPKKK